MSHMMYMAGHTPCSYRTNRAVNPSVRPSPPGILADVQGLFAPCLCNQTMGCQVTVREDEAGGAVILLNKDDTN